MKPVDYMQTDSRWRYAPYQAPGEKSNIGKSGCGITCAAMVIASLADDSVTPVTTAEWSMKHGYKAYRQGTYYSYFVPQLRVYGIKCEQMNGASVYHGRGGARGINASAADAVENGDWVICAMGVGDWTRSGHFVLWYGVEDGYALILDPNSKKASRRKAPLAKFQYQAKYYFRVEVEEVVKQEDFNKMMDTWLVQRGLKAPGDWSKPARDWAYEQGIMTGGAYMRPITREEACQVLYQYDKKKGGKQNAL